MTNCKIGKIKLKNGGSDLHVITQKRTHFHNTIENIGKCIADDTHAIGFFVLYNDGTLTSGISYNAGFTPTQLKGSCEHMRDCLVDHVWGCDE